MSVDAHELLALPPDEKLRLIKLLWDSLGESATPIPLPDSVDREAVRRREEMRDASVGVTHEETWRRIGESRRIVYPLKALFLLLVLGCSASVGSAPADDSSNDSQVDLARQVRELQQRVDDLEARPQRHLVADYVLSSGEPELSVVREVKLAGGELINDGEVLMWRPRQFERGGRPVMNWLEATLVLRGSYRDGRKHGRWIQYKPGGAVLRQLEFRDGELVAVDGKPSSDSVLKGLVRLRGERRD